MVDRIRRYRVTGTDRNGDVHAFETDNQDRAKAMQDEFKKDKLLNVGTESIRWGPSR